MEIFADATESIAKLLAAACLAPSSCGGPTKWASHILWGYGNCLGAFNHSLKCTRNDLDCSKRWEKQQVQAVKEATFPHRFFQKRFIFLLAAAAS